MPDGLDVVAIGVEHEGSVIPGAVFRPRPGLSDVAAAVRERRGVEFLHRRGPVGAERDVRARRDGVLTGIGRRRVNGEPGSVAPPEPDLVSARRVLLGSVRPPAEWCQRGGVERAAALDVGDADVNVIDVVADSR